MITDINMRVADDFNVTSSDVSPDSIDTNPTAPVGQTFGMFEVGDPLFMVVTLNSIGTPGAGTIQFAIIADSTADLATAPIIIGRSNIIADEDLLIGKFNLVVTPNPDIENLQAQHKRFIGCSFIAGTDLPAGFNFTVDFVTDYADGLRFHKSGFEIG